MKRTPIRRRSDRQRARDAQWTDTRHTVHARSGGRCERCEVRVSLDGLHAHHRKLRAHGRDDSPSNVAALCGACHESVHREPEASTRLGWLVPSWATPGDVPVRVWSLWVRLTDDGGYVLASDPHG